MSTKSERVVFANDVISKVSGTGRRFFYNHKKDFVSSFSIGKSGHIYFTDHYNMKPIYMHVERRPIGFTNGGGLWVFCKALRDFIRNGETLNIEYMGQYWGYGDDMPALKLSLKDNPAFEKAQSDDT